MNKAAEFAALPFRALGAGLKAAAQQLAIILPGRGANYPWGWGDGADRYSYAAKIGDGRGTSILSATVGWIQQSFPEAPLVVSVRTSEDEERPAPEHPLSQLIETPNPFYDGALLMTAMLADLLFDGNGYWIKGRSGSLRPTTLWWVPSTLIQPIVPADGSGYVTAYDYRPLGYPIAVPSEDVVHFRYGLDPQNIRKGLSPIKAQLREAYTDEEAAMFSATVLRNMALPGLVLSPSDPRGMTQQQADLLRQNTIGKFSGERRGEPLVSMGGLNVSAVGWSPQQMDLSAIRNKTEERLTASLHIPAAVVGFGAGLERATYDNIQTLKGEAWNAGIIPLHRLMLGVLRSQLVPDFDPNKRSVRLRFDTSQVKALQEETNNVWTRANMAVAGEWFTVGQALAYTGQPHGPEDEYYLRKVTTSVTPGPGFAGVLPAPQAPPPIRRITETGASPSALADPNQPVLAPPAERTPLEAASLGRRNGRRHTTAVMDRKATEPDVTPREARTRTVNAYSTLLEKLWAQLASGEITEQQYLAAVREGFDAAVGSVPDDADAVVSSLRDKALEQEAAFAADFDAEAFGELSEATVAARATFGTGLVWAAANAAEAAREDKQTVTWQCADDERSCDTCSGLDGMEWGADEDHPWPGDGTSECGGSCRCDCG